MLGYRIVPNQSHPKRRHKYRSFIASNSIVILLPCYFLLLLLISFLYSVFHALFANYDAFLLIDEYLIFFAFASNIPDTAPSILQMLGAVTRIVLNSLLLGSIVFKVLEIPNALVFSQTLYYDTSNDEKPLLVARCYSQSSLEIVDVTFEIFVRARRTRADGQPAVTNNQLTDISRWATALPNVPYAVRIPLLAQDVSKYASNGRLNTIQNHRFDRESLDNVSAKGHDYLVIIARGTIPRLDKNFTQTQWYQLDGRGCAIKYEDYPQVGTIPGSKPRKPGGKPKAWYGWENFE